MSIIQDRIKGFLADNSEHTIKSFKRTKLKKIRKPLPKPIFDQPELKKQAIHRIKQH